MPLELLTLKDLENFKTELLKDLKKMMLSTGASEPKKLLKSREVRKILRISPGTLLNLRRNQTLGFRKIGGIIYYHAEEVDRLTKR